MSSKELKRDELWDVILGEGIATNDEMGVALHFGGNTLETLESLLFYKTGYRTLEQYKEYEYEDEEEE